MSDRTQRNAILIIHTIAFVLAFLFQEKLSYQTSTIMLCALNLSTLATVTSVANAQQKQYQPNKTDRR